MQLLYLFLLQTVLIPFILLCYYYFYFLPTKVSLRFQPGGESVIQQRDEQEEIWEQSVSAACLLKQEETIMTQKLVGRREAALHALVEG